MAPFGQKNPVPTFLSRDLEVVDARALGQDGHHLRLKLRDRNGGKGAVTWHAIAFSVGADRIAELDLKTGQRYDVVYSFSTDRGGNGGLELMIRDLVPAGVAETAVDVGIGGRA